MAKIEPGSMADIEKMTGQELMAQQISNHGAMHVLEHLLEVGPTEENVLHALMSLRKTTRQIKAYAADNLGEQFALEIDHEH